MSKKDYFDSTRALPIFEFKTNPPDNLPFTKNGRLFFQPAGDPAINRLTFGWSVYNASWEYYMTMQLGVLSKAKELGIDIISQDQRSSTIEMVAGATELLSSGINALIISPYNPEAIPAIVANADKNKLPVVLVDGGTGGADVTAFIVSDSFGGGILAGEYALSLMKKYVIRSKNVAIIKAEKTATYALLRGDGFKGVLQEKGYQVVAEVSANGNREPAYLEVKRILSATSNNLAVIFCENGLMTLGAAQAIDEVEMKGKIMLIGFDADPSVIEGIKGGFIQGTIAQQPFKMGELGVELANFAIHNIPIVYDNRQEKEILMEVYLIDENGEKRTQLLT